MKINELKLAKLETVGYLDDDAVSTWLDRVIGKNYRITTAFSTDGVRYVSWVFAATPFELEHLDRYLDDLGVDHALKLGEGGDKWRSL